MPERHPAPRHRSPRSLKRTLGRFAGDVVSVIPAGGLTRAAALVGVAGVAVGVGVVTVDAPSTEAAADLSSSAAQAGPHTAAADEPALRPTTKGRIAADDRSSDPAARVSRSATRPSLASVQRATKTSSLPKSQQTVSGALTDTVPPADPRDIAMSMLAGYGWSSSEFTCVDALWASESGWDYTATNPTSGAYGIPQALPAEKMASAGSDWQTNPATQIEWGYDYIRDSYGTPCSAWSFKQANDWY